ncbi:efflux RND transporter periplasmic adaptor subunit [Jannaschia sp. W003]|uniref:efflux RND transporter periplasmic adaptor subunit n=1 Tax=Jannaschia sp. W003 TaxID=2867012 RepID=UPI0021A450F7|nr:efflux RND transporter periplasmic adaptor subunit [Jannaschia sp. W003]UWQ20229.1 efflux RND transporter periplasmic adaptor subunit [Jannaschia sp. W003]
MRPFSVFLAVAVCVALFFLVLQREALLDWARAVTGDGEETAVAASVVAEAPSSILEEGAGEAARAVHVVALRSVAREVEDAVMVRGQTAPAREVVVSSETSGTIVSEPLRKGTFVEAGETLCELDPGSRVAAVTEAEAGLAEARARIPEAEARIMEAEARRPEAGARLREAKARLPEVRARVTVAEAGRADARARIAEAEARLEEARINQNAAARLSEDGFASQTRVANADAALRAAEAGVAAARTGLESVEADIESARAVIEGALAQIESAEAGVVAAEAGVENARAGLAAAEAAVQSAEAAVENARLDIAKLAITAPFDGLLETDTAELGALLQPGSPCATVVLLDPIKLVGFLPEAQVARVEAGAPAGARLASGREVAGRVAFVSRSADETTRTFRTEVTVPNPDLLLRGGQTVEIVIRTDPIRAHQLPASALTLNDAGTLGVRVIEDGRAAFAPVDLVRDSAEGVLVAGLEDEADVIVVGQEYVTDGVPVQATFRGAAAEPTQ